MTRSEKPECRVLQIFSTLGVGGAEVWLLALLRHFDKIRNELPVTLKIDVLLTGGPGEFDEEARSLGARLFYVPYSRNKLHRFIPAFRKILASGRYHAIHDHQDYAAGMHFLFGLGQLPPVRVVHVHNPAINIAYFASSHSRRLILSVGKRLVGRLATQILGTSRQLLTEYGFDEKAFAKQPKRAAHCGFDVSRYRGKYKDFHSEICREFGWDDSSKLILFVGRLDSNCNQKNPAFALEVAKDCARERQNTRTLIVGGGDRIRKQFEREIRSEGFGDSIRFTGIRADVPRLMLGSDVLLFPSVAEGLGMVAVEAQAAGLRVIASDTTPGECVVVSDAVQFLPLDDGPQRWSKEVLRTLNLPPSNRREWNQAVHRSPFSIDNSAATLLSIYQDALSDVLKTLNPLRVEWARN